MSASHLYETPPPVVEASPIAVLNRGTDTPENRADAERILRTAGCQRVKFEIDSYTKGLRCLGYAS
jgi:hypothetical protein